MKKILFTFLLMSCITGIVTAQRYAYLDSKLILEKMPQYTTVQKTIETTADQWQKEIDGKQELLNKAYDQYDEQEGIMSAATRKKAEDDLFNKEKELRDLQKKYFGFEGELFKKRQQLMQPLQEKLMAALNKVIQQNNYDLVLDKSEGKTIIFANPKLDITKEVLAVLGVK